MTVTHRTDPRQPGDPVPLADAIGDLFSVSGERDRSLRRWLDAWRDGWEAGRAAGWADGYLQCASDVKAAEHGIADHLARAAEIERGRWRLRGQARSRRTFGQPHPGDYPGRDGAA